MTAPTIGYPIQFYPLASSIKGAEVIDLAPGVEKTGIDFRMKTARVYAINGTVTSAGGPLGQNAVNLTLAPRERNSRSWGGQRGAQVDQRTGAFQFQNVFPGSYYVMASAGPLGSSVLGARQPVDVSDQSVRVNVTLEAPLELTGTIHVEGDRPPTMNHFMLELIPIDSSMGGAPPRATIQADGAFVVKGVFPGAWRMHFAGPSTFVKSVQAGGRDLPDNVLDTSNGLSGPLRVTLSTKMATIKGSARPGQAVSVTEISGGAGAMFATSHGAAAGPTGEFTIGGLAPGKYRVWTGSMPEVSPDEAGQEVVVTEGGVATVVVKNEPAK
jgi:hypothetical protein